MIAERTVEMWKRFGRESALTGVGAGIQSDLNVALERLNAFYTHESPEKQARILEAARRYRAYADRNLKYMVEKGRLSQKQYDQIKADNTQYVALQRILETAADQEVIVYTGEAGSLASRKEILKKLKGGTELIKNPYESLIGTTVKVTKEADQNEVMQKFRDLFTANRGLYQGQPKQLSQVAWPASEQDKNKITIFVNGEKEHWGMQPDVYKAVKNMTEVANKFPWMANSSRESASMVSNQFPGLCCSK